jgi:hypothetical protein
MFSLFRQSKSVSSVVRYPQADFDAMIVGALRLAHELEIVILEGRQIARQSGENRMTSADVLSLIDRLKGGC